MKKIAIIGLGRFGTKLFERFNKYGNVKFVCDRKINGKLLDLKNKYDVEVCDNYREILDKIDMVVIATPSNTHYSIVKECLLNKKDVFVEKPLCVKLEEAKELINIAKKENLKLYVDDVFLFRKEYQEFKNLILGKNINKIKFTWKKYGTFDDSIVNALVYHDMYMLIDLLGEKNITNFKIIKNKDPLRKGRCDILEFSFNYNGIIIECKYDRTYHSKEKDIEVIFLENKIRNKVKWSNDKVKINNKEIKLKKEDALSTLIFKVLNNKVDYSKNNFLALKSIEYMEQIKKNKIK